MTMTHIKRLILGLSMLSASAMAIGACVVELDTTEHEEEVEQGLCVPAGCDEYGCWGQQGDCGPGGGSGSGGGGDPSGGGGPVGGPWQCQPNPGSGCADVWQYSTADCSGLGVGANFYCVGRCGGSLSHCMLGVCVYAIAAGENGCR